MKSTIIAIVAVVVIIGGAYYFATRSPAVASTANVSTENGKQIIEIDTKGSYLPRLTAAKANVPTILRVVTSGVFSCANSLKIPSIGFQQQLPLSGTTDIELPPQPAGAKVNGICAMGMYSFEVDFQG